MGNTMTLDEGTKRYNQKESHTDAGALSEKARRHLWMHFTRHSAFDDGNEIPIIVRGEGAYIYDNHGREILDGIASLYTCMVGHGRTELADVAAEQMKTLEFFPLWAYAHPAAINLAERLASYAPGNLNRVFFTGAGGEAVESAWKLARQYFKATGKPGKYKVVSRYLAYHGTTMGALSITGLPGAKQPFEPLVPGAIKAANTNFYRAPAPFQDDLEAFGLWSADQIEAAIMMEGPESVAAVFIEPVQNAGGCFTPPPGYLARVREICDRHDVLMVADETICGFGRIGGMFAMARFGVTPDIITCAKGLSSGYAPIGAMIVDDRLFEPFDRNPSIFMHGFTYGGHTVSAAVALANLDIMEREGLVDNVLAHEEEFSTAMNSLRELDIVGDVRGAGYFWAVEMVKDKATKETFNEAESDVLLRGFLSRRLWDAGLHCRADDRGDPVVQVAPSLIIGSTEIQKIRSIIHDALSEAQALMLSA